MVRTLSKLFPHPLLSSALFVMWLLMNVPFGAGSIVIGALAGVLVPHVMSAVAPERVRMRKPRMILILAMRVLIDVIQSNWNVSKLILGIGKRKPRSGFVRIPLSLTDRYGLAALAIIITGTPGTLWVQYDRYKHVLLLHVLDLDDDQDWAALIKDRYEAPLKEIFP